MKRSILCVLLVHWLSFLFQQKRRKAAFALLCDFIWDPMTVVKLVCVFLEPSSRDASGSRFIYSGPQGHCGLNEFTFGLRRTIQKKTDEKV